ncbi:MAG: hypothetical protein BAJALOKI1v1_1100002 [Promethearchaeota archaeon]|nr:MAG: hypothetical protein BAJALOKI1v1_1100002 [Candidatus Lokiarchaeota archaeon]
MSQNQKQLIFVYNANSDAWSLFRDFFIKIFRPSKYPCNLCMVTFGPFTMKRTWKEFIEKLSLPTRFLHKDEFKEEFDQPDALLPCAYLQSNDELTLFITQETMNSVEGVEELKDVVIKRLIDLGL